MKDLTLTVPSKVLAITNLFKESVASPVIERSLFEDPGRDDTSGGHAPIVYDFLRIPDCMLYMCIAPVEVLAIPKFPHAETQTDLKGIKVDKYAWTL